MLLSDIASPLQTEIMKGVQETEKSSKNIEKNKNFLKIFCQSGRIPIGKIVSVGILFCIPCKEYKKCATEKVRAHGKIAATL